VVEVGEAFFMRVRELFCFAIETSRKEERKTVAAAAGVSGNPGQILVSQDEKQSSEQELRRNRTAPGQFFR
jgi:hypothetical protein